MLLTGLFCGILLGFVMQRGCFCITGAFRDLYVTKNNKMFVALLSLITGYYVYKHLTKPAPKLVTLKPRKTGLAHLLFEKYWRTQSYQVT